MAPPAIAVPHSKNAKTGPMAATYASQASCPASCPLRNAGCYAESGPMAFTTRRLNASVETNPEAIALAEAIAIDALPGNRPLRVHVVGDCSTPEAAPIVGAAMVRYVERSGFPAFTYTHAWRDVPYAAWQGATVIASCDSPDDIPAAKRQGYARTAIVLPGDASTYGHKAFTLPNGQRVVPCPEISGAAPNCLACGLCLTSDRTTATIGFPAHGARVKAARIAIAERMITNA